jgi:hypothetical protein
LSVVFLIVVGAFIYHRIRAEAPALEKDVKEAEHKAHH